MESGYFQAHCTYCRTTRAYIEKGPVQAWASAHEETHGHDVNLKEFPMGDPSEAGALHAWWV